MLNHLCWQSKVSGSQLWSTVCAHFCHLALRFSSGNPICCLFFRESERESSVYTVIFTCSEEELLRREWCYSRERDGPNCCRSGCQKKNRCHLICHCTRNYRKQTYVPWLGKETKHQKHFANCE
jgi:hypothetical protein